MQECLWADLLAVGFSAPRKDIVELQLGMTDDFMQTSLVILGSLDRPKGLRLSFMHSIIMTTTTTTTTTTTIIFIAVIAIVIIIVPLLVFLVVEEGQEGKSVGESGGPTPKNGRRRLRSSRTVFDFSRLPSPHRF